MKELLEQEIKKGNLIVNKFKDEPEYKNMIAKHISHLTFYSEISTQPNFDKTLFHFKKIIEKTKEAQDGNLLVL